MKRFFLGYMLIMLSMGVLSAQDGSVMRWLIQGDSLRLAYRFEEAEAFYRQAATHSLDTIMRNRAEWSMILCENGLNMLQYAVNLKVLGSAKIPRESFYLYLSSDPRTFWAFPDAERFPELSQEYPAFVSPPNKTIIFTGKSANSNHLDLYISHQSGDTLWSYPQLMGPAINSSGNECYPVLSTDGQTLYFASDGHYGMGGFDLYVSHFDKESGTWSQAQNMGFPYSSPENDFAFMPAPDGLSALFISDRGGRTSLDDRGERASSDDRGGRTSLDDSGERTSSDERAKQLVIYMVEHELNPERYDWRGRSDLLSLAQLYSGERSDPLESGGASSGSGVASSGSGVALSGSGGALSGSGVASSDSSGVSAGAPLLGGGVGDYTRLVQTAKKIRDDVVALEKKLASSREAYTRLTQEDDRLVLAKQIEEDEIKLIDLQEKYRLSAIAVQKVEMEFLQRGILPSFEYAPVQQSAPEPPAPPLFTPQQGELGTLDSFLFAPPIIQIEPIDISFRVEKVSQIVSEEEWPIPDYLFYRIQISVNTAPAQASSFKGISPIFESETTAGKYLYAAGQFNNYTEASKALTQVQRLGFKNALVIAYNQGKSIPLATARRLEPTAPKAMYRLSLGSYPHGLPQTLSDAIKELSNKDLARITGGWEPIYVIGPFGILQEARSLQKSLVDLGFEGIVVEMINP